MESNILKSREDRIRQMQDSLHNLEMRFNNILHRLNWNLPDPDTTVVTDRTKRPDKIKDLRELDIWFLSRAEKLSIYENVIAEQGHLTEPEFDVPNAEGTAPGSSSSQHRRNNFSDMVKLQRDLKRRRMKYRTSKAPLTYTEEIRTLIQLQMESWTEYLAVNRKESERGKSKDRRRER